jgi:pimeloyl-[acyl-carrier protein] methyl ester esterase
LRLVARRDAGHARGPAGAATGCRPAAGWRHRQFHPARRLVSGADTASARQFFRQSPRQPEQTLQRFVALLCQGDRQARALTRTLLACLRGQPAPAVAALGHGLDWLREVDLRPLLPTLTTRSLLIHGENDRLNPVAAAQSLSTTLPDARLEVFAGAGHAPFLTDPEHFVQLLENFCHARPAT